MLYFLWYISPQDGPQFEQNNTEYDRCIGERVQIVCNVVGQPLPDVSLFFNGALLKTNSRSLTYDILVNAMSQFGRYICVANNTVGAVNITTAIIEKRKYFIQIDNGNCYKCYSFNEIFVGWLCLIIPVSHSGLVAFCFYSLHNFG